MNPKLPRRSVNYSILSLLDDLSGYTSRRPTYRGLVLVPTASFSLVTVMSWRLEFHNGGTIKKRQGNAARHW